MEGWVPEPTKRVFFVSAETATDRAAATDFRTRNFPPGPVTPLTATVIVIDGTPTANPGPLRELVLPIAQAIRGGVYGQTVLFVSSAMDGVGDYLQDLAFANDIGLYWSENPDDLESARPVGDLEPDRAIDPRAIEGRRRPGDGVGSRRTRRYRSDRSRKPACQPRPQGLCLSVGTAASGGRYLRRSEDREQRDIGSGRWDRVSATNAEPPTTGVAVPGESSPDNRRARGGGLRRFVLWIHCGAQASTCPAELPQSLTG